MPIIEGDLGLLASWLAVFLLGFDSLLVCAAVGSMLPSGPTRLRLALLLGVFDAVASCVGAAFGLRLGGVWVEHALAGLLLLYALSVFFVTGWTSPGRSARWLIYALPLLLSLDNLVFDPSSGPLGPVLVAHAVLAGSMSAAMAVVGLLLSGHLNRGHLNRGHLNRVAARASAERVLAGGLLVAGLLLVR